MVTTTKKSVGIVALNAEISLNDAFAIAMFNHKVAEFDKALEAWNKWHEEGLETPKPIDPQLVADPISMLREAVCLFKKLTFVEIGESNVFDDVDVRADAVRWNSAKTKDE